MFERILCIVSEKQENKRFVMDLARANDSSLLLSGVMSRNRRQVSTDGYTRNEVTRESTERKCWQDLYRLEEEFKRAGIKATVVAQQGGIENLRTLANSTHCSLILVSAHALADDDFRLPDDLIPNLPCPLLITNPE
jgi:hypothetical protein